MARRETTLQKIANVSQLFGILVITMSILGGFFPNLRVFDVEYLIGGIGLGVIFAWIIPFWIKKIEDGKLW